MKSFILMAKTNSCYKGYAKYKQIKECQKIISKTTFDYDTGVIQITKELESMKNDILCKISEQYEISKTEIKLLRKINWLLCELSFWLYV